MTKCKNNDFQSIKSIYPGSGTAYCDVSDVDPMPAVSRLLHDGKTQALRSLLQHK
jgi:hypothetical protein